MRKSNPRVSRMQRSDRALIEHDLGKKLSMVMSSNPVQLARLKRVAQLFLQAANAGGFRCKGGDGEERVIQLTHKDADLVRAQAEDILEAIKRRERELGVEVQGL